MSRRRLGPRLRLSLFLAAGGRCQACGHKIAAGSAWHLDHVIPLALGGPDAPANLQLLCRACHRLKTSHDLAALARAKRRARAHAGRPASRQPLPCGRMSPWKRTLGGQILRRLPARRCGQD
jgi:5-methylcytosine-specific restriction endonuclease McrA